MFIFLILIFGQCSFAYFDTSTPVQGDSISTNDLQLKIVNDLYKLVSSRYSTCSSYKIKDTQILHFPYDVQKKNGKYVKGYWKELWSIDSCGIIKQAPVSFYIKKKGTIYNIDKSFMNN